MLLLLYGGVFCSNLEVRPTAAANEKGVSREARALVVEHKRHASGGVAGRCARLHVPGVF